LDHGPQVLHVEQEQAVVVGDLEDQGQHAGLRFVEVQEPRKQKRPHVGHGGAHRVSGFAVHVPEDGGIGTRDEFLDADGLQPLEHLLGGLAGRADAGEVPFDIGHENGDADGREGFGHLLQCDGLPRAGRAGDEPVPVGHVRQQDDFLSLGHGDDERCGHGTSFRHGDDVRQSSNGKTCPMP